MSRIKTLISRVRTMWQGFGHEHRRDGLPAAIASPPPRGAGLPAEALAKAGRPLTSPKSNSANS